MTIVVYKNNIIAADSGASVDGVLISPVRKIINKDRHLYGGAGIADEVHAYFDWIEGGSQGEAPLPRKLHEGGSDGYDEGNSFILLHVTDTRTIYRISAYGRTNFGKLNQFAIGSGAEVAYGALFAGADAETAVRAACQYKGDCVLPVQIYDDDDELGLFRVVQ